MAKNMKNVYDDDNIPEVDLPRNRSTTNAASTTTNMTNSTSGTDYDNVEPLPESSRPRKDGPGGA